MPIRDKCARRREIDAIENALETINFGSIEITIHDAKIVQIEIREKIRFANQKKVNTNPAPTGLPADPLKPGD